jgi:DNA-binding NarL/FixJ family response regulator
LTGSEHWTGSGVMLQRTKRVMERTCALQVSVRRCPAVGRREHDGMPGQNLKQPFYRFVIADDHPLFRGALREAVAGSFDNADIAEAGCFDEVSKLIDRHGEVDLVLLDLAMPGVRGFSGLLYLRAQYPGVPVVVVSGNQDLTVVRRCMEFGASGFIPKTLPVEMIREAIGKVLEGAVWYPSDVDPSLGADSETRQLVSRLASLTPQQVRVLMMLSEGLLNKQIAYALAVSEATVKAHVSAILQKLGADSRTQAVIIASKIDPEQWQQAAELEH